MGCSIYGRRRLALVQKQGGIYMAAEYLLDFYSALRILCAFFFQTPEKRPGSIRSRSAGDARHQSGPARGSRHLWRTDTDRILHAAVYFFKGRGWAHNKQHKGSVGSTARLGSAFHSFSGTSNQVCSGTVCYAEFFRRSRFGEFQCRRIYIKIF